MVIGENLETDAEDGKGKFAFTLTQYTDNNLADKMDPTEVTPLGSRLYFQIAMENPVAGLIYSINSEF